MLPFYMDEITLLNVTVHHLSHLLIKNLPLSHFLDNTSRTCSISLESFQCKWKQRDKKFKHFDITVLSNDMEIEI